MLKECHGHQRIVLTGMTKFESYQRSKRKQLEVDKKDNTKIMIHPIFFWKEVEIWEYTREHKLPVNPLYAEGQKRIGCVMCPMGGSNGMKADAIRWPQIARRWKNYFYEMYEYQTKVRGKKYKNWKSGDCVYQWWIENIKQNISDELCLF